MSRHQTVETDVVLPGSRSLVLLFKNFVSNFHLDVYRKGNHMEAENMALSRRRDTGNLSESNIGYAIIELQLMSFSPNRCASSGFQEIIKT